MLLFIQQFQGISINTSHMPDQSDKLVTIPGF